MLTWFVYFLWYDSRYQTIEHFGLALSFLSIFFVSFYLIFLAYKIAQSKKLELGDVLLVLANSFIFYGIGYSILNNHDTGEQLLGLFTLINAVIHFIVSFVIFKLLFFSRIIFPLFFRMIFNSKLLDSVPCRSRSVPLSFIVILRW